ncbi:hypothetical protein pb186bvf_011980 [Paramecium bursaria]
MGVVQIIRTKFGNLRLQTQLLYFSFITIMIIIIIAYSIFMLQIFLVNTIYKNSTMIAAQKQIWNQMVILQKRQVIMVETFQDSIKNQMVNVNQLLYLNLSNYTVKYENMSLNNEPDRLIVSYNITNISQRLSYKEYPGQNLIHQWIPLTFNYDQVIDVNQMFWFEQKQKLFTFYNSSQTDLNKFYNFSDQLWYYNWMNYYQKLTDKSEAYQLVTFQPVSFTQPLLYSFSVGLFDKIGGQIGVITSQFKIQDFYLLSLQFKLRTLGGQYFVTKDGMYISRQQGAFVQVQIYNQSQTGYNKEDWDAIKQNNLKNSNCHQSGAQDMLCRFNTLYQMDTIISCNPVLNKQFYIVSIALSEQYIQYVDDFFQVLLNLIWIYIKNGLIVCSCVTPIILIIIIIFIKKITQPLNLMRINMILTIVKSSNLKQNLNLKQSDLNQLQKQRQIKLLLESYGNLIKTHELSNLNKNFECKYFQNLKYNSNRYENYSQLKNIKQGIRKIPQFISEDISIFTKALKCIKSI